VRGGVQRLEDRPGEPLAVPEVLVRVPAERAGEGGGDEAGGRVEGHVRADAGSAARPGAEVVGQPLGEPALDPAGGHRDDVGGEGVGGGLAEHGGERRDERVGSLGTVHVQHGRPPSPGTVPPYGEPPTRRRASG